MKNTILIIEDDTDINNMLQKLLQRNGYSTISAFSGTEAVLVFDDSVELVLLDLMLPGKRGEEVISALKAKKNVPVIVTSAVSDTSRKVDLFNLGADDYVTKPFDNDELLARIAVRLKNVPNVQRNQTVRAGSVICDKSTFTATCNGQDMLLSRTEFDLLYLLVKNVGQVCTKSMIYDKVWDYENSADDNTLNVHISKLRRKIKDCGGDGSCIETVWGIGYRIHNS